MKRLTVSTNQFATFSHASRCFTIALSILLLMILVCEQSAPNSIVTAGNGQDKDAGKPVEEKANEDMQEAKRIPSSQKPKRIKYVQPVYPQAALTARVQGMVIIETTTDIFGRVRQAKVIAGHPLLNDAALTALKQWIYEPYVAGGVAKPVIFVDTVTFSL